jgi:hypothetical protein
MTAVSPDNLAETLKAILAHLVRIETRMDRIEEGQQKLRVEMAEVSGRVSQLPTSWQMLTAIVATVFTVTATTAGVLFAALNYAK